MFVMDGDNLVGRVYADAKSVCCDQVAVLTAYLTSFLRLFLYVGIKELVVLIVA